MFKLPVQDIGGLALWQESTDKGLALNIRTYPINQSARSCDLTLAVVPGPASTIEP